MSQEDLPFDGEMHRQQKPIRSFVRRSGRMSDRQRDSLHTLYSQYGLAAEKIPLDIEAEFGRMAPLWVEVGFGNGDQLIELARRKPECNFLGIEVHRPGVGSALDAIERFALQNVRVVEQDAVEVLTHRLAPGSVSRLLLLFPDPWHKKRHNKRRFVNSHNIDLATKVLADNGHWHMATDWEDYAEHMQEAMACRSEFTLTNPDAKRPDYRVDTRFERRGQRLGHGVWDFVYRFHSHGV